AVGLPLRVREDLIGLLALYPPSGRTLTADELALVTALAAQLAVAVQNARLHEEVKRRDAERLEALEAEQQASRTLRSFYEISRAFAQSLSFERTLEAVVRTSAELLELDDRDRSGLDAGGGAGNADAALARSGAAARRGRPRARALRCRPGGPCPRECAPLPAAEAIRGHHAEVAATSGVSEDRGARARRRLRVLGPPRRGRRRLRLPPPRRRPARRRTRGRHRTWNRRRRGHGDGEVRLP